MNVAEEMGARIRQARRESDWTLEALAAEVGTGKQSLIDWETGKSRITSDRIPVLAKALGKPVGWLFGEEAPAQPQGPTAEPQAKPAQPEPSVMELLARQQELVATQAGHMEQQRRDNHAILMEQQAMMERQRADVARLTELLARQQDVMLAIMSPGIVHGDTQQIIERKKAAIKASQDATDSAPERIKR